MRAHREEGREAVHPSVSLPLARNVGLEGGRGFISPEHGSPINQGRFSLAAAAALGLRVDIPREGERERV